MRHTALASLLSCAGLLLTAPLADAAGPAAGPAAALVEFRTEGEIAPAVREKLAEGLQQGLSTGLTVTPLAEATATLQAANPGLAGCQEAACLKEMGRTLGQRVLVQASARSEMEFYHLGLTATDAHTGRVLLTATGDCEICTLNEAAGELRSTAERFSADLGPLVSALPPVKKRLTLPPLKSPPPTPPVATAKPPAKGFPEAPTAPPAAPAPPPTAELPPVPGPDPTPPGPADPPPPTTAPVDDFPYGVAAFGALAGGLALLGTGGVLIAKDGDSTCDNKPLQQCPTVYDTGQAGLVTVVLGGAGLLTSVVLFLMQQAATGQGPESPPELPKIR